MTSNTRTEPEQLTHQASARVITYTYVKRPITLKGKMTSPLRLEDKDNLQGVFNRTGGGLTMRYALVIAIRILWVYG